MNLPDTSKPRIYGVMEIDPKTYERKYYTFRHPWPTEEGFYRSAVSINAFFFTRKSTTPHTTNKRTFSLARPDEYRYDEIIENSQQHFDSVFEFYKHIGYDYKKRKYSDPEEKMKRWK